MINLFKRDIMKNRHYIKNLGFVALMLLFSVTVSAQEALRTGYFLKGNAYRYRINPAMTGDQNFVSLPTLGNLTVNTAGNFGLANFIYKAPNGTDLVTFMHPSVKVDDFLGALDTDNRMSSNLDLTLFSAGFRAFGGYNTIDLGVHSRSGLNIPHSMFEFMKVMGSKDYSIRNLNLTTSNYVDIALGHSRKVTHDITVGARLKFLLGAGYADVLFDRMDVSLNGKQWMINAQGSASIALGGEFTNDPDGAVDGYENITPGVNGFGMGLDLGITYDFSNVLTEGLVVSASVNDIGFMNWSNVAKAGISNDSPFVFDGFENISMNGDVSGASIEDQFNNLGDDLEEFLTLKNIGSGSESKALSATLNLGVEYSMPFYKNLSVGALYTSRFDKIYPLHQFSLMANIAPVKWFDLAVSGTASNMGAGFGAMANIHLTGFNLFVGTDCFLGKVSKEFIPLDNMNSSVSLGINIPFGKRK